MSENLNEELKRSLINCQRDELTEHFIYSRLAESTKNEKNRGVLKKLSEDELEHYGAWQKVTDAEPKRKSFNMWKYC
jgi:rubrerythrin